MPFYKRGDEGSKNRWRINLAHSMRRSVEGRKCPKCERLGGLGRLYIDMDAVPRFSVRVCRYCGYERYVEF